MSADSITDTKPSASEVTKPKTEIKNKPSPSSEHKSTTSEQLSALRKKIENIFTRRESSNQPPSQTLKELAATEIPQDTQKQAEPTTDQTPENNPSSPQETSPAKNPQPEKSPEPKPIIPDTTQQDQAEITQLTQAIQDLKEEPTPQNTKTTPETPPPQLFPDRPSLYEQHHETYKTDRETSKGKLTRIKDILILKKSGIKNATQIYDGLRSRGILRDQIMHLNPNKKPRITQIEYTPFSGEKLYINVHQVDLPKAIDRLYSIGKFDAQSFDTDGGFQQLHDISKDILILDDTQFSKRRTDLQSYLFLKDTNVSKLFTSSEFRIKPFLDYVTQNYFSGLSSDQQFTVITNTNIFLNKDWHQEIDDYRSALNILEQIVKSNLKPEERISVPQEVIYPLEETGGASLNCLNNLNDREHQKYFLLRHGYDSESHFDKQTFLPQPSFYDSMINSLSSPYENLNKEISLSKIDIPKSVIDTIYNPYFREFYTNLSQLPNIDLQKHYLDIKEKGKFDLLQYFKDGKPNFRFYVNFLNYCANTYQTIDLQQALNIPQSMLESLDSKEQQAIKLSLKMMPYLNKHFPKEVLPYTLNPDNMPIFLDTDGTPTTQLLDFLLDKTNVAYKDTSTIIHLLKDILSLEVAKQLTGSHAELWRYRYNLLQLKNIESACEFLSSMPYTAEINSYFTPDHLPTSLFFQKHVNYNLIKSNLTPELLSTFSPEEQKFWQGILGLKDISELSIQHIVNGGINPDLWFNSKGQPKLHLFETLIKINYHQHSKFLESNLTKDIIDSFPKTDQRFWKFLLEKNFSLEPKKRIISDSTLDLIINNKEKLANDNNDIDFLNNIIGMFGKKNEAIIKGYLESLTSGTITKEDKPLVLEFLNEFSVLGPNIIKGYKEAKRNHTEKLFISNLKEITQKLTSSKNLSEAEYQSPYYRDLIQHAYPNNVGHYTNYDSNDSCSDRSNDLSQFNIKDVYQIDLLSQGEIKVKDGEQTNPDLQIQLEKPVLQVLESLQTINFNQEIGNQQLHQQADILLSQIDLHNIDLSQLSIEDKLFILASESIYHHQNIDSNALKKLLITYEFINFEDIRNFIQGTNDKVSHSSNPDYAHLCELNNFYSDRIKEVNKKIIESVSGNTQINQLLPSYFQRLVQENSQQSKQEGLNKLQIDKLGLTNRFVDQLSKTLKRRFPDKNFTSEQIKRMLRIYETVTQGLTESKSTSPDKNTQAFYGQIRSQREKTFYLLKQLGDNYIDPRSIHLDEINLQQVVNLNQSIESKAYNQDEFLAYTAQKFIDIFSSERSQLETELSKYVSTDGSQMEILNAYIIKTKASANARMVGGVCVSGDNPISVDKTKSVENMWDTPNYFQMVFQDPEISQCLGLCLLHHFEENGKKILTVSFNPSSTYLYSVDESSLFNGIYNQLQNFAQQNNFDIITTSKNHSIRTNRTGGIFEQSIDKKVSQIHKTFSFSEEKQFSYRPEYKMKDMDIIWER